MKKVFIDGSAGTTGLRIRERLESRSDITLVKIDEPLHKDPAARKAALNSADVAFLCLPDDAARESAAMVENPETVIIDTSTAHRTSDDWAYGFPEIGSRRGQIASSKRIANPGCHASGFIALVAPLVENALLSKSAALSAYSLTGYSGGGKKMIAQYEDGMCGAGGRQYALGQSHKHLPEMMKICSLSRAPVFSPIVVPHYSGMQTVVMLQGNISLDDVKDCYRAYYSGPGTVSFREDQSAEGFISSAALSGRDDMTVGAYGKDGRIVLVSLFDNLGKGASGAAVQNMNIALGCEETKSLDIRVDLKR
jgi:N-acetyl-gamma-glutamyl-phosphate reductase